MFLADRKRFTLGTLSHILNEAVNGYSPLPDFPLVAPDAAVRNVKVVKRNKAQRRRHKKALRRSKKQ